MDNSYVTHRHDNSFPHVPGSCHMNHCSEPKDSAGTKTKWILPMFVVRGD